MEVILETLREQGRSQRWLAGKLGIHESYFAKYRAGILTPSPELIRTAGSLLGLPESVLFPYAEVSPIGEEAESEAVRVA
jgi:transcriptional regulator with XRE-family HTH domain